MTQHSLLIGIFGLSEATPCRLSSGVIDPASMTLRRILRRSVTRPLFGLAPRPLALAAGLLALGRRQQRPALDGRDAAHTVLAARDRGDRLGHGLGRPRRVARLLLGLLGREL